MSLNSQDTVCVATGFHDAGESDMKIYLLMLLIGSLMIAIHFTSAPRDQSKTLPQ